jgi:kynureninase
MVNLRSGIISELIFFHLNKYLNSGPGGIGGLFLHEKHFEHKFPRLNGWWGNRLETRFKMSHRMQNLSYIIFENKKLNNEINTRKILF